MRGRPNFPQVRIIYIRNTPAYAGKTGRDQSLAGGKGKHPRVCGEDSFTSSSFANDKETPPRMRGRRIAWAFGSSLKRNTPAYAGKTLPAEVDQRQRRKHPRVCGEDQNPVAPAELHRETPPRMRGRRCTSIACPERIGNTPAYAGKTGFSTTSRRTRKKHPRVCGEDFSVCI